MSSTPDRIVTAMTELMRRQGYAATSVSQLADAAGVPTGSIYHAFRGGKRDVAAEALRTSGRVYIQLLPLLMDAEPDLPRAVEGAFAAAAEDMATTGWANMCPVGTVAGEVADVEPELREVAAEAVAHWVSEGTAYLVGRGLDEPDARELVHALLAGLEGAFVLARTLRDPAPLLAAGRATAALAHQLQARPAARRG